MNMSEVKALWQYFSDNGIIVDVYISNAAAFTDPITMMDLSANALWSMIKTNFKSPVYFTEKFSKQGGDKQKFIINVTTANIHATQHPIVAERHAYTLGKFAGTLFFQYLAQDFSHDKIQVVSFHPGLIYNEYWKSLGIDVKHFDDDQLSGSFAVWAASEESAFLQGRTVWCSWDVEEFATGEIRNTIDEDFYFLRGTIAGLNGGNLA
ncbi:hypothetical protein HBI25_236720 [Parastagonospora nodorum]|nr:hypothetical protein HBH68_215520 [Parastagonospora nodorum]KAH5342435.1 hypothetical protein HBI48_223100 [Parastagonospora nodorum]KAH5543166.1 hypothetical protein HBI25_236720 [Parastagonospora nodorum]KAH5995089.1 hypothetical protein HBI83_240990 [Parastagonospora nodorum]KAH6322791.1 hypothetical protein HBI37_234000 [Parastagonospora nodorum]